ncbi:MAG: hypothetical protein BA871_10135 [Desulfuromonadales bacterium C00003096]|nr:MAG: hypothetical protein BA871_10135 [Desulfuromonadales bacterium C00003096]
MKRQTIATLVLLATAMSIISIGVASADLIYVPDDHARIQWAVDNATIGDTIIVRDATYTENVDLDKQLTICSENGTVLTMQIHEIATTEQELLTEMHSIRS